MAKGLAISREPSSWINQFRCRMWKRQISWHQPIKHSLCRHRQIFQLDWNLLRKRAQHSSICCQLPQTQHQRQHVWLCHLNRSHPSFLNWTTLNPSDRRTKTSYSSRRSHSHLCLGIRTAQEVCLIGCLRSLASQWCVWRRISIDSNHEFWSRRIEKNGDVA